MPISTDPSLETLCEMKSKEHFGIKRTRHSQIIMDIYENKFAKEGYSSIAPFQVHIKKSKPHHKPKSPLNLYNSGRNTKKQRTQYQGLRGQTFSQLTTQPKETYFYFWIRGQMIYRYIMTYKHFNGIPYIKQVKYYIVERLPSSPPLPYWTSLVCQSLLSVWTVSHSCCTGGHSSYLTDPHNSSQQLSVHPKWQRKRGGKESQNPTSHTTLKLL